MRIIDAEALENIIYKFYCKGCRETGCDRCRGCKVTNILGFMKKLCGTVEAKPVVHAHWENWGCQGTVCSNCHGRVLYECDEQEEKSKFCPHCGAQMDEPFPQAHENGVKIPVISMEDVPKIMEEMEK